MKEQVLNITSKAKKTCKYFAPSSYKLFKTSKFSKLVIIQLKIQIFPKGYDNKVYIKMFGIYPTIDL